MHYHTFWLGKWWSSRWHFGVMTILGTNLNGTWPNEPRWTVQLNLWIDLSAKNLWHWNFNSNGAAKEWRNGPGSQWISGLLSEFKLPTDSPFDYIHHVTSCYVYCNYLYLIYICILFWSIMYFMCICASIPNPFMVAEQKRRGTARSLGLVSWPPRGQRPMKVSTMFLANQLVHFRPTLPIGSCVRSFGSFWSHFAQFIFNYLSELQRLELQSQVASHIRNPRLKSIPRSPALKCQGNLRSSLITCSLTVIRCRPRLSKDTYKH